MGDFVSPYVLVLQQLVNLHDGRAIGSVVNRYAVPALALIARSLRAQIRAYWFEVA
jgi:hypothetical protein